MWEARHELVADARPEDVWPLWSDPARWADWNRDIECAWLEGPLESGAIARIKFRRRGTLRFRIIALEPGRLLIDETRLPLVRMGHAHRVEPVGEGVRIRNLVYLDGPAARLYGVLMGRRIRASVITFVERERELAEAAAAGGSGQRPT